MAAQNGKPGLLYRARWTLLKRLFQKSIVADVHQFKLSLDFTDICARPMYFGQYEHEEAALIEKHVKPGMTVLDIGANIGYFTLMLARLVGPRGVVHAFEPNPRIAARLERNVKLNPELDDGRIRIHNLALGKQAGSAQFFCPTMGREGAGGLKDTRRTQVENVIDVKVGTLDEFAAQQKIAQLGFIKIDVEGGEFDAFRGGEKTIAALKPVILFEAFEDNCAPYGHRVFDVLSYLEQRGFTTTQAGMSYNFLAVPR